MPLTDTAIRKAKPAEKPYKLTDEKGLFLLVGVKPGALYWRIKQGAASWLQPSPD